MKLFVSIFLVAAITAGITTQGITIDALTKAVNEIRADPIKMKTFIEQNYKKGTDCSFIIPTTNIRNTFSEKCGAIDAAIARLAVQKPCPALKVDEGFTKISYDHSQYQINVAKLMTHTGPAGRVGLGDRCKLFNKFAGPIGENIADGVEKSWDTAMKLLAQWVIDDGVPNRGHYNNIYKCEFTTWGVGIFNHKNQNGWNAQRVTTFFGNASSCVVKKLTADEKAPLGLTGLTPTLAQAACPGV
jgi:uncharacterized protein YkwD